MIAYAYTDSGFGRCCRKVILHRDPAPNKRRQNSRSATRAQVRDADVSSALIIESAAISLRGLEYSCPRVLFRGIVYIMNIHEHECFQRKPGFSKSQRRNLRGVIYKVKDTT